MIFVIVCAQNFHQCGMCNQQSLRSAGAYAQSDQSLCYSLEYSTSVKLQTEDHLGFLSLRGGCIGSSESTLVKTSHCWKSHVKAHFCDWYLVLPSMWHFLFSLCKVLNHTCDCLYIILMHLQMQRDV